MGVRYLAECRALGDRSWHSGLMPGREIDPVRAKSALAVVKQHPVMLLILASPAILGLVLVGYFVGTGWAVFLGLVLVVVGTAAVLLKR